MRDEGLEREVREMIETGVVDPVLLERLRATDPETLDRVLKILKDGGAEEVGNGAPLQIEDYYRDSVEKFELKWPLGQLGAMLPPFEGLDRKTQFFALWTAWTNRELEAMNALNRGQVDEAEAIFDECADRAKQIDIGELLARSFEGKMRVAQKRGDRAAEQQWSERAMAARRG